MKKRKGNHGFTPTPKIFGVSSQGERGFTLIELLVVIAIIGIITSIVLVFLGEARARSNDTKVKSQLTGLRTALENYYITYNNYAVAVNGTGGADISIGNGCANGIFNSAEFTKFTRAANYPATAAGTGRCTVSPDAQAYAVSVRLDSPGTFWCIDSRNNSKQTPDRHNSDTYVCP